MRSSTSRRKPHSKPRRSRHEPEPLDFETLAAELVRELRGKLTQAALSKRLGYSANVVHRWESGRAWPTAAAFLRLCEARHINLHAALEEFLRHRPPWLVSGTALRELVAAFLTELRGKTPLLELASASGINRYTVARWHRGTAQPRLPDFLRAIEASSRRALDFVATLVDPSSLPSVEARWAVIVAARRVAYGEPWSHGVLRAMELDEYRQQRRTDLDWLTERLGMTREQVAHSIGELELAGQLRQQRGRYVPTTVERIDTRSDPSGAKIVKLAWTEVAVGRLRDDAPGYFGFSLFSIGRSEMQRLRELHQEYVRAMQSVIAQCSKNECVGLYCAQLVDLDTTERNALRVPGAPGGRDR